MEAGFSGPAVNLNSANSAADAKMVIFGCEKTVLDRNTAHRSIAEMSESAAAEPKPTSRGESADQQVLAQVERWMAVIREISAARRTETKLSS